MKLSLRSPSGFQGSLEAAVSRERESPDPVDQIAYAAELGFAGVEDSQLVLRPVEEQERIG